MNRVAQKVADILGSAVVIIGFGLWMIYHNSISWNYTNFISDVAIEIGLLILRAEKVQSDQQHEDIKRDIQKSDKVLNRLGGKK